MLDNRTRRHLERPEEGVVAASTMMRRLRQARRAQGRTQVDVAYAIGVKLDTLSRWERCRRFPDAAALYAWCRLLAVSPNPES